MKGVRVSQCRPVYSSVNKRRFVEANYYIYGVIFYNEIPDLTMISGTFIIIATGLYTFYREKNLQNQ